MIAYIQTGKGKNDKKYYLLKIEVNGVILFSKFIRYTEVAYYEKLGIEVI